MTCMVQRAGRRVEWGLSSARCRVERVLTQDSPGTVLTPFDSSRRRIRAAAPTGTHSWPALLCRLDPLRAYGLLGHAVSFVCERSFRDLWARPNNPGHSFDPKKGIPRIRGEATKAAMTVVDGEIVQLSRDIVQGEQECELPFLSTYALTTHANAHGQLPHGHTLTAHQTPTHGPTPQQMCICCSLFGTPT